ncbi:hypothetical protein AHW95_18975 [Salmonella enterica subsp. enterica]|nr:hypothetical protein [Salmonella enterica subsp. enterica]
MITGILPREDSKPRLARPITNPDSVGFFVPSVRKNGGSMLPDLCREGDEYNTLRGNKSAVCQTVLSLPAPSFDGAGRLKKTSFTV